MYHVLLWTFILKKIMPWNAHTSLQGRITGLPTLYLYQFCKEKICIYSKDCLLFPMGIMVVIKILKSLKSVFTSNPLKKSAKIRGDTWTCVQVLVWGKLVMGAIYAGHLHLMHSSWKISDRRNFFTSLWTHSAFPILTMERAEANSATVNRSCQQLSKQQWTSEAKMCQLYGVQKDIYNMVIYMYIK